MGLSLVGLSDRVPPKRRSPGQSIVRRRGLGDSRTSTSWRRESSCGNYSRWRAALPGPRVPCVVSEPDGQDGRGLALNGRERHSRRRAWEASRVWAGPARRPDFTSPPSPKNQPANCRNNERVAMAACGFDGVLAEEPNSSDSFGIVQRRAIAVSCEQSRGRVKGGGQTCARAAAGGAARRQWRGASRRLSVDRLYHQPRSRDRARGGMVDRQITF